MDELTAHMNQVRQEARQICSLDDIDQAIARLASDIAADYADKNPLLITVMNGGLFLAGRIMPLLDFPLEMDYLHATRYGKETVGKELQWIKAPEVPLLGRHVLIVDDILDEGHTLNAIIESCQLQDVASVKTVVLVDKQHDRKAIAGMKADYTGMDVEDVYLFGAGMDYKGYWRNAPGLFALTEN